MVSIDVGPDDRVSVTTGADGWFRMWPAVGGAKLELWLQLQRFTAATNAPPLQMQGRIGVRRAPHNTHLWLTDLTILMPVLPPAQPGAQPYTARITDEQLRLIDRLRRRDGSLLVSIEISLMRPDEHGRLLAGTGTLNTAVLAGEWIRELERVEAATYVEVLVPITDEPARAVAARRIREARTLVREGKFDQAIMTARAALEQVRNAAEVTAVLKDARNASARDRTLPQRWAIAVDSFYSLACGAAHDDEVTATFAYSRADAEAIIATTASLLTR